MPYPYKEHWLFRMSFFYEFSCQYCLWLFLAAPASLNSSCTQHQFRCHVKHTSGIFCVTDCFVHERNCLCLIRMCLYQQLLYSMWGSTSVWTALALTAAVGQTQAPRGLFAVTNSSRSMNGLRRCVRGTRGILSLLLIHPPHTKLPGVSHSINTHMFSVTCWVTSIFVVHEDRLSWPLHL